MTWERDIIPTLQRIKDTSPIVKKNNKLSYYNIPISFDIETSSFYEGDQKRACMYVWAMCINGHYFTGRTWDEFLYIVNQIIKIFGVSPNLRVVFYVHNLSYELQFIKHYFTFTDVMSNGKLKPIKCVTDKGVEFRCSYLLSGYSLSTLANVYLNNRVKKMVGDLDYSLLRHNTSRMSRREYQYLYNDVRIVYEFIKLKIDNGEDMAHIPNTKTGYVRRVLKLNCLGGNKRHVSRTNQQTYYVKTMRHLTISNPQEYAQMQRAFQGGFTHCSCVNEGKVFSDVASFDFTSSYPTCLIAYQFPMSRGHKVKINNRYDFEHYCKAFCCIFDIKFVNIRSKIIYEHYISTSKCDFNNQYYMADNGRVVEAAELTTTITNVDFEIIKECYEWDEMYVANFNVYTKGYLPKPFIETILDLYEKKTTLKGVSGREQEYQSAKENINSLYGACCTKVIHEDYIIKNGEWVSTAPNKMDKEKYNEYEQGEIEKYNKTYNRTLFFPWGVFCTAYARYNLFFGGIFRFGVDYIYSDTDSVKVINYNTKEHKKAIKDYNEYITNLLKTACDFHGIPHQRLAPKTIKGVKKPLGVWDFEGAGDFKALRSKCYMTKKDGHFTITVSGLAKNKAVKYLHTKYGNDLFKVFNNKMYIPRGHTGKQTHTYINEPIEGDVIDYQGVKGHYKEMSCVHLEETDYSLELTPEYINYLLRGVYQHGEY